MLVYRVCLCLGCMASVLGLICCMWSGVCVCVHAVAVRFVVGGPVLGFRCGLV